MSHAVRTHARYAASAAHRWLICSGYARMAAAIPERPSPPGSPAWKGTQAHEALEHLLRSGGVNAYAHTELEPDYAECVQIALDYVLDVLRDDPEWQLLVETPFDLSAHVGGDCGGTADVVLWHPRLRELRVLDLKTGRAPVQVERNPQEMIYAAGVCLELKLAPSKIVLVIVAARALDAEPDVREWTTSAYALTEFLADVEEAVRAGEAPDAPLIAGPHCEWCPAAVGCAARERHALAVVRDDFATVWQVQQSAVPAPEALDPARLSFILQEADRLRTWLRDVETFAEAELRAGRHASVPGWKLVAPLARSKWDGEPEVIGPRLAAISGAPVENFVRPKLIGITEAKAELTRAIRQAGEAAGAPKKQITEAIAEAKKQLAFLAPKAPSNNLTLVPDADPRPAFSPTGDAFAGVTLEAHGDQNADDEGQ